MHSILNEMKDIYAKAKICPFNNRLTSYCELSLEPGINIHYFLNNILNNPRIYTHIIVV